MKKVIFISALAIAAAVSCTKSDIVDTKFNEAIGFETYLGRDAQTKASVATTIAPEAGIYGFYTGAKKWGTAPEGEPASSYIAAPVANLWDNYPLSPEGIVTPTKYWTNASDYYSFVAYAPKDETGIEAPTNTSDETPDLANPVVKFTVQPMLKDQIDFLYAQAINVQKPATEDTPVDMLFKHGLSRLTVKAKRAATAPTEFEFDVKEVSISGPFKTTGNFTLYTGAWDSNVGSDNIEYLLHRNGTATTNNGETTVTYNGYDKNNALTTADKDYAYYASTTKSEKANNYLMMIPTTFATNNATLKVVYTTFYEGQESKEIVKSFTINQNFKQGCAYAISLEFTHEAEGITFNVDVEDWKNEAGAEADPDKETDVTETPVTPAA
jgi:hypothetical protein